MIQQISEGQWGHFWEEGYLRLGKLMTDEELSALQKRMNDIMLGQAPLNYDRMRMQLDSMTGDPSEVKSATKGHKGATLNYRKIQELEFDPLFLSYMQKPLFRDICAEAYGPSTRIACFRAMFLNKPAKGGTYLRWHQDRFLNYEIDRDPIITVWTALDSATVDSGCVKIIPRSHRNFIDPEQTSDYFREEQTAALLAESAPMNLESQAGECILLHNMLVHSSDVNKTACPRRAFSVCYIDAATKSARGKIYSIIFGEGALRPELVNKE
jgi:hypothetical protein